MRSLGALSDFFLFIKEKFMKSRQAPAANVVRRARPATSSQKIVEVVESPLDSVPESIIPSIRESGDEERDRIDIMGDISPATLPGVTVSKKNSSISSRPKKSLFALKREQKKLEASSSLPLPSSSIQDSRDGAHDGILSDLVERDVISFDDHPIASQQFAMHEHGFPETEKIDLGLPKHDSDEEEGEERILASKSTETAPESKVFYSSARDRLESQHTIDVHEDDVNDEGYAVKQTQNRYTAAQPKADMTSLMQEISKENDDSIGKMAPHEVERLQQELASHLNPKFIQMLRERGRQKNISSALSQSIVEPTNSSPSEHITRDAKPENAETNSKIENRVVTSTGVYSIPEYSKKSNLSAKKSNFLAEMERKKREWMLPIKPTSSGLPRDSTSTSSNALYSSDLEAPEETPYMNAEQYRFDFEGKLLSFASREGHVEVEKFGKSQDLNMLLHHGDQPTLPGYTMDEFFHLARSAHPSQRISAIRGLGNIIYKAKACYYSLPMLRLPSIGAFVEFPNNLFLSHLMSTLGIGIALRIALDDASNTQILESLYALHALLCAEADENISAMASIAPGAIYSYPMKPRDDENISLMDRDWDDKSDVERCESDLIFALLQTGLLARFRYLLESKSNAITDTLILQIMIRCARHSLEACEHFKECPGLFSCFKKILTSATSSDPKTASFSRTNLALLIKLIKIVCQGSREACRSIIVETGLFSSSCLQLLYMVRLDSLNEEDENNVRCCIEILGLMETCLRYGMLKSETLNIFEILLGFVSNAKYENESSLHGKLSIQSAAWRVLTAIVPLARDIPEGEKIPSFLVLWSQVSPIVPLALSSLRSFDNSSFTKSISSDLDSLLASILEFLASYFGQLSSHPPRNYDDVISEVKLISQNNLAPFLIQCEYFSQLVNQLSRSESWEKTKTSPSFFNVEPEAMYALSLRSHPTWSWKALRSTHALSSGGGNPQITSEQNLYRFFDANVKGSTLLHRSSVLLSALRVVSSVNKIDTWLSASLTASEISGPISSMLERYSEWAMQCSGSRGSVYGCRVLHLMAFHSISLLYRTSVTAQESGLICLSHLMPGDELLALRLIQRTTLYYTQEDANDLSIDQSLSKRLDISKGTFAYLVAIITDGLGGDNPRSHRINYLKEDSFGEDHPMDRSSLQMDVEASFQPLGKNWVYNAFTHYSKHRMIEENELAMKRQKSKNDAIKRGVEAHWKEKEKGKIEKFEPQKIEKFDDPKEEEIEIEVDENMELFGDYENAESKRLLDAGRLLICDSLQFALNVERSNTVFAKNLKRSTKLNALMQIFTLGPKFFMSSSQASESTRKQIKGSEETDSENMNSSTIDDGEEAVSKISKNLKTLISIFVDKDWEPARLDTSIVLNTAIIEKVADIWANESFGDATIGLAISLWLSSGSELEGSSSKILESGQSHELRSIDSVLWPHFSTLWHLLPLPPKKLEILFLERKFFRPLVTEYLLLAMTSPHTQRMRNEWNFWYRFILFQLSQFFVSNSENNQNKWIRLNALQSLISDLSHLELKEQRDIFKDLFELTPEQIASPRKIEDNERIRNIELVQQDEDIEYFAKHIRHIFE